MGDTPNSQRPSASATDSITKFIESSKKEDVSTGISTDHGSDTCLVGLPTRKKLQPSKKRYRVRSSESIKGQMLSNLDSDGSAEASYSHSSSKGKGDKNLAHLFNALEEKLDSAFESRFNKFEVMMERIIEKSVTAALKSANKKIAELESSHALLENKCKAMSDQIKQLTLESNHSAQYSRKSTVRILGIPEAEIGEQESTTKCIESVVSTLNAKLPNISTDDIEIAHRVPGRRDPQITRPRSMIVKFFDRKTKDNLMKTKSRLKGSGIVMFDDLSPGNRQLLYNLKQYECIDQAWSSNGKIFGKSKSGSIRVFTVVDDLSLLGAKVE